MVINQYQLIEEDIIRQLKVNDHVVVGIDGMSASGKSTLTTYLEEKYFARVIHMDDFFLQDHQRLEARLNEVGGNLDYERFYREVIYNIKANKDIVYQQYNCQTKSMTQKIIEKDFHLLVIEGAYALRSEFRDVYDLTYLMVINSRTQIQRIKTRSEGLYERFVNEWIPMENSYIDHSNLQAIVDRVIIN